MRIVLTKYYIFLCAKDVFRICKILNDKTENTMKNCLLASLSVASSVCNLMLLLECIENFVSFLIAFFITWHKTKAATIYE